MRDGGERAPRFHGGALLMTRLIVDLSDNDLGKTDPACLKADGVDGVVIGVFSRGNPPHDMVNLGELCMSAGLPVIGVYGFPYFGDFHGLMRDTHWACDIAPHFGVTQVWMDVETDAVDQGWTAPRPTPAERIDQLRTVRRYIENKGLTPGVYTFPYWWTDQMANTFAFSDLDLWLATYGPGSMPTDPLTRVNFGGWYDPIAAHQYTSLWGRATGNPCGRTDGARDASYWYKESEDDMDQATKEEHVALVKLLGGRERLLDVTSPEKGMDYLLGYGMEQAKTAVLLANADQAVAIAAEAAAQAYRKTYLGL